MKKRVFFFVLSCLILLVPVFALSPGYKEITYCVSISNSNEYSEYTFLLYEKILGEYSLITENNCASFGKNRIATFYAIESSKFIESQLGSLEAYREYFSNNPDLISSNSEINSYGDVAETSNLVSVEDSYVILSIDETLELEPSIRFFRYADGSLKNESFYTSEIKKSPEKNKQVKEQSGEQQNKNSPWPENIELEPPEKEKSDFPYYILYIGMPLAVVLAIIVFKIRRKNKVY